MSDNERKTIVSSNTGDYLVYDPVTNITQGFDADDKPIPPVDTINTDDSLKDTESGNQEPLVDPVDLDRDYIRHHYNTMAGEHLEAVAKEAMRKDPRPHICHHLVVNLKDDGSVVCISKPEVAAHITLSVIPDRVFFTDSFTGLLPSFLIGLIYSAAIAVGASPWWVAPVALVSLAALAISRVIRIDNKVDEVLEMVRQRQNESKSRGI